jgi:D-beta-D-heptose 7-phosphate kinase/D-beta-D-heptose 1-phosphate adenosyltransferase
MKTKFQEVLEGLLENIKAVIVSDYAKGMFLSESFCSWLIQEARRKDKLVFVDPKSTSWKKYEGATTITPNLKEFKATLERESLSEKSFQEAAKRLIQKYGLEFLTVTLGKEGIYAYHPETGEIKFPARAKEVFDVSGAGDTVIASLAAFYSSGLSLKESLYLANLAAGIVVGKMGTKPVYFEEIEELLKEEVENGENCIH